MLVIVLAVAVYSVCFHADSYSNNETFANSHKSRVDERSKNNHSVNERFSVKSVGAADISLGDFLEKWDNACSNTNDDSSRIVFLRGIASLMAQNGYSREAIAKIVETFGPGKARCHLLSAVFRFSPDSGQLSELFGTLEYDDERMAASEGIAHALAYNTTPEKVDVKKYEYLKGFLDVMLATLAEEFVIANSSGSPQDLTKSFELAFDLPLSSVTERTTLMKLYSIAPFDCWDYIARKGLDGFRGESEALVEHMVRVSGKDAADKLASTPQSEALLARALSLWMKVDASAPIKWIQERTDEMTGVQRDSAYSGIAAYAIEQGELDVARSWSESISSPEQREVMEGRIWGSERDSLRREVGKDPAATLQSIISGQSKYGDYWLEEAMGTWVAKDYGKAQEWYQENWSTLPANKSQYVAAAFANQAIKQRDTETARQWAAHIQDAETKQRIEANIAKAEGQKGN
mgnify:CR=1 FL=1